MKRLVFHDGSTLIVTGENNRHYICGNTQFKKMNKTIKEVVEIKDKKKEKPVIESEEITEESVVEQAEEIVSEEKPKTSKKSKKTVKEVKEEE